MKRIAAFYYLRFPDGNVDNPDDTWSEVYVEVGDEASTAARFEETYAIYVYTLGYLVREIREKGLKTIHAGLVVPRFDDHTIEAAVNESLGELRVIGRKVGK